MSNSPTHVGMLTGLILYMEYLLKMFYQWFIEFMDAESTFMESNLHNTVFIYFVNYYIFKIMYYINNYHVNIFFNLFENFTRFYHLHSCFFFLQTHFPTPSWIHDIFYNQFFINYCLRIFVTMIKQALIDIRFIYKNRTFWVQSVAHIVVFRAYHLDLRIYPWRTLVLPPSAASDCLWVFISQEPCEIFLQLLHVDCCDFAGLVQTTILLRVNGFNIPAMPKSHSLLQSF